MTENTRASFDPGELAVALSHFNLGVIESITEFPRGSTRSPKVGIVAQRGKFLLKRLAAKRADPNRVRFAHRVQEVLADQGFPIARLVATRDGNQSFVRIREHVYELFEYIPGQAYRHTTAETHDGGLLLARFHDATDCYQHQRFPDEPSDTYHAASSISGGLHNIGSTLTAHDSFSGDEAELAGLTTELSESYERAAEAVTPLVQAQPADCIIHGDWHPGNLLFRNDKVVAVIDYDSVRWSPRIVDVANGALQFSMIAAGDPATWPDEPDESRFAAFLEGYESLRPLPEEVHAGLPALMIESLIAECVPPITRTGSIGRWSGFRILQMIRRKVRWLAQNGDQLRRRALNQSK